jgi:hypothetical protein
MDSYQFEKLIARLWESYGYDTSVRNESGDRGVDIEATKQRPFRHNLLIQAKRYRKENKVGSDEVRKYATLYQQSDDVDIVILVTSSKFTQDAQILANDLDVRTVNGAKIASQIVEIEDIIHEFNFTEKNKQSQTVNETDSANPSTNNIDCPAEDKNWETIQEKIEENCSKLFTEPVRVGILSIEWMKDAEEIKEYTMDIRQEYGSGNFQNKNVYLRIIPQVSHEALESINKKSVLDGDNSTEVELYVKNSQQLSNIAIDIVKKIVEDNDCYVDISFEERMHHGGF